MVYSVNLGLFFAFLAGRTLVLASYHPERSPAVGKTVGKGHYKDDNDGIETFEKKKDERNGNGADKSVHNSYHEPTEEEYGDEKGAYKGIHFGKEKGRKGGESRGRYYKKYNKGVLSKKYYKPYHSTRPVYRYGGKRYKRSLAKLLWKLKQKFIAKKKDGEKRKKERVNGDLVKKDDGKKSHPPAPKTPRHKQLPKHGDQH